MVLRSPHSNTSHFHAAVGKWDTRLSRKIESLSKVTAMLADCHPTNIRGNQSYGCNPATKEGWHTSCIANSPHNLSKLVY
eukprot:scaffold258371_cov55-Attheya_sp.AAC.1